MVKMEYGRKKAAFENFFVFMPKPSEMYQKPANAGKKSSRDASSKCLCLEPEPELFVNKYQEF